MAAVAVVVPIKPDVDVETPRAAEEPEKKRPKRKNGEGCVYPWPGHPGKWRGRFTIGGKVVSFSGDSERAVQKKADQAAADFERGVRPDKRSTTVGDYFTAWLASLQAGGASMTGKRLGEETLHVYARQVTLHIVPELGALKLKALEPEQIRRFITDKAQGTARDGVAHARNSLKVMVAVLKMGLEQAAEDKYFARSPAARVRIPTAADSDADDVAVLEPDELARLMAVLPERFPYHGYHGFPQDAALFEQPYQLMFRLLLATGMRSGELRGLRWQDVDFARRQIAIRHQAQRSTATGVWQAKPLKSRTSRRTVGNLPAEVWTLLESYQTATAARRAQTPWLDNAPLPDVVFLSRNGLPIDDKHLRTMWAELLAAADIARPIKLHNCRHTHGSYLLYAGWPAIRVAWRLGHKQVATLEKYYVGTLNHVRQAQIRAVLPALINEGEDEELTAAEHQAVQQLWHPSWHTRLSHDVALHGGKSPQNNERAAAGV